MEVFHLHKPDLDSLRKYSSSEQQDIKKLLMLSFKYSQGDATLQSEIFKWAMTNGFLPYPISRRTPSFVTDIKPPRFHGKVDLPAGVKMSGAVTYEWISLYNAYLSTKRTPTDQEELLKTITKELLETEVSWQKNSRPGRPLNSESQPDDALDPYKSFFRKYVLQAEPTAHPAYNELFRRIGALVQSEGENTTSPLTTNVQNLARLWNRNHAQSGQTFFSKAA